jgi:hypothetical protein
MTARSEQFRRFEYSTNLTTTAKDIERTALQRDIDAWLRAGNTIQVAPPLEVKPRPIRKAVEPAPVASIKEKPTPPPPKPWSEDELQAVRYMKARGMSNASSAMALNAVFGNGRTSGAVKAASQANRIYRAPVPKVKKVIIPKEPTPHPNAWTPEEDQLLRSLCYAGLSVDDISQRFTEAAIGMIRRPQSIYYRCRILRIEIARRYTLQK